MSTVASQPLTFHERRIRVDPRGRTLHVDGVAAKLGGRAFDLLDALIERRDRVVSKQELMDLCGQAWSLEENNLQVHVASVRLRPIDDGASRGSKPSPGDELLIEFADAHSAAAQVTSVDAAGFTVAVGSHTTAKGTAVRPKVWKMGWESTADNVRGLKVVAAGPR